MSTSPTIKKAAVLLSSLDQTSADAILVRLPEDQAAAIVRAIDEISDLSVLERDEIIGEFLSADPANATLPFPTAGDENYSPTAVDESCPLAFAAELSNAVLGTMLGEEHPQAAAILLAHLPPQRASLLLNSFTASARTNVLQRVADLTESQCELLPVIAAALRERVTTPQPEPIVQSRGLQAARAILAAAGNTADSLVGDLRFGDSSLAQSLQFSDRPTHEAAEPTFSFRDLEQLSDAALATVFGSCSSQSVLLSLAGATPAFTNRMLAKLAPHEAEAFQKRMHQLAPLRLRDVEEAQRTVVEIAESLMRSGEVSPPTRRFAAAA